MILERIVLLHFNYRLNSIKQLFGRPCFYDGHLVATETLKQREDIHLFNTLIDVMLIVAENEPQC